MIDWSEIEKSSIVKDRTLLKKFTLDYQKHFGKLNIGCKQCIDDAYRKLTHLKLNIMDNPKYRLKAKYEGTFFNGKPIRNGDLTEEVAKELLEKHPHGAKLFDILPKEEPKKEAPKKRRRRKK